MGIHDNLLVSIIDTTVTASAPLKAIPKLWQAHTTDLDIIYLKTLGAIVAQGLVILSASVIISIFLNLTYRYLTNIRNQKHEIDKKQKEIDILRTKLAHEDKMRDKEYAWKVEHDKLWKDKEFAHKLKEKELDMRIKECSIHPTTASESHQIISEQ